MNDLDMKIKEPGVYDIPMSDYHSDNCDGPSISSSGLRTIHNECPAEYWAFSYLNPDRFEREETSALGFGRAAHCLILGDEVFHERYAVRPDEWRDWRKTEARRWKADQEADGKTVLIPDQMADIWHMAKVLEKHPMTPLLMDGKMEKSLIWQDLETAVWLKARPDVLPNFAGTVVDYKTTASRCHQYQLTADIEKYGYFMQMALIAEGMEILLGAKGMNFALVFQQKKAPYHVVPIEVSPEYLEAGRVLNRKALRTFANCYDKGEWPGYVEGIPQAHPPEWLLAEIEQTTADAA